MNNNNMPVSLGCDLNRITLTAFSESILIKQGVVIFIGLTLYLFRNIEK